MNEPEQYQPTNTDERQETADAAPVSSSSDAAASSQPEYGQIDSIPLRTSRLLKASKLLKYI